MLGRIEMPDSIVLLERAYTNIWDVKPVLQSLVYFFFFCHRKISLNLNLSSISGILSMQMNFWSLIVTVSFSSHTDEEMVTHMNEVSISEGFFGIKECTDKEWGYRGGKTISFR